MNLPTVSFVIPTFNEEEDLETCLKSIVSQDYPREKIEIIVVDDYSTDNTVKVGKKYGARILNNGASDNETGRKIGFMKATGELFMVLDADMKLATKDFLNKMTFPFIDNKDIAGNFVRFRVNKNQPPLTRCLSYDAFQRDPIYKIFTIGPEKIIKEKKNGYYLCKCNPSNIPPQGCFLYRRKLVEGYAKTHKKLTDNEIPTYIIYQGNHLFAFVPDTGIEHMLLRSLKELWFKRTRNTRVYSEVVDSRKFKWFSLKKDWPKAMLWILYTNSFIFPIFSSFYKTAKHKDLALLSEPAINFVSTYSIIISVLFSKSMAKIIK
jgi:glycosyltransferase involved in cell wall biosynthesis